MRVSTFAFAAAVATGAVAQDQSLCDKYTSALFAEAGGNSAENQYALLVRLVNTVVIGSYVNSSAKGQDVPGILKDGQVNGETVSLAQYFNGSMETSNRDGKATSVNFLADGGATPLTMNMPANTTESPQYYLLTHLYSYFGGLLMCSKIGEDAFPKYAGQASMASVHKFMTISANENNYFIGQVGAAAASFGVSEDDVKAVGNSLTTTFGMRCSGPAKVVADTEELQAICQDETCPQADPADCAAYSSDSSTPASTSSAGPSPTSGAPVTTSSPPGMGASFGVNTGLGLAAAAVAAFAL